MEINTVNMFFVMKKLAIEKNRRSGCILLFLEGGFYRAYEHSALDAIKNLHEFKVTCRFYKAVGERVACIGFPVTRGQAVSVR